MESVISAFVLPDSSPLGHKAEKHGFRLENCRNDESTRTDTLLRGPALRVVRVVDRFVVKRLKSSYQFELHSDRETRIRPGEDVRLTRSVCGKDRLCGKHALCYNRGKGENKQA